MANLVIKARDVLDFFGIHGEILTVSQENMKAINGPSAQIFYKQGLIINITLGLPNAERSTYSFMLPSLYEFLGKILYKKRIKTIGAAVGYSLADMGL